MHIDIRALIHGMQMNSQFWRAVMAFAKRFRLKIGRNLWPFCCWHIEKDLFQNLLTRVVFISNFTPNDLIFLSKIIGSV